MKTKTKPEPPPVTERQLPTNRDAEIAILGAILLDNSTYFTALDLEAEDFAFDAHRRIYLRMTDLMAEGKPIDFVTLTEILGQHKEMEAVGGLGYVTSLTDGLPRVKNIKQYVDTVKDKAKLRKLIHTANLILESAYDAGEPAEKIVGEAERKIAQVVGRPELETTTPIFVNACDFTQHTPNEIDWVVEGIIERGANGLIVAPPKTGKAQPNETPVLTPSGWRPIGDLKVGDEVISPCGCPTKVIAVHPQGVVPCYRVEMSDGTSTETCEDHLWKIQDHEMRNNGKWQVVPTSWVKKMLEKGKERFSHIPVVRPIHKPVASLPLKPYLMGALLGDGGLKTCVTFTSADDEVIRRVNAELPSGSKFVLAGVRGGTKTFRITLTRDRCNRGHLYSVHGRRRPDGRGTICRECDREDKKRNRNNPEMARDNRGHQGSSVLNALKALNLFGNRSEHKFIPRCYLDASIEQRMNLLRGILDTDGWLEGRCTRPCFASSSKQLSEDVAELVESLGGVATRSTKPGWYYKNGERRKVLDSHVLSIKLPREIGCPFYVRRKAKAWEESRSGIKKVPSRRIVSVEFSRNTEARCITVSNPDGLYITEHYIVTHNSLVVLDLAIALAAGQSWMTGRTSGAGAGFYVPRPVKVAMCAREDAPGLSKWRLKHLAAARQVHMEELTENLWFNTKEETPRLMIDDPKDIRQLIAGLEKRKIEFLILDVFRRVHSADENDADQMQRVIDLVCSIQEKAGCQVALIHHKRKENGDTRLVSSLTDSARGSSVIAGYAEWIAGIKVVNPEAPKHEWVREMEVELKAAIAPDRWYCRFIDQSEPRVGISVERCFWDPPKKGRKKADNLVKDEKQPPLSGIQEETGEPPF